MQRSSQLSSWGFLHRVRKFLIAYPYKTIRYSFKKYLYNSIAAEVKFIFALCWYWNVSNFESVLDYQNSSILFGLLNSIIELSSNSSLSNLFKSCILIRNKTSVIDDKNRWSFKIKSPFCQTWKSSSCCFLMHCNNFWVQFAFSVINLWESAN